MVPLEKWSPRPDLNWWPPRYQRGALPTELHGRNGGDAWTRTREPRGSGFTVRRSCRCATSPFRFQALVSSNSLTSGRDSTPTTKTCQCNPRCRAYRNHKSFTGFGAFDVLYDEEYCLLYGIAAGYLTSCNMDGESDPLRQPFRLRATPSTHILRLRTKRLLQEDESHAEPSFTSPLCCTKPHIMP